MKISTSKLSKHAIKRAVQSYLDGKSQPAVMEREMKKRKYNHIDHKYTYDSWKGMRTRCTNPNQECYKHYGGRGIKICKRWDSFTFFCEDMGLRPDGLTLDRIDNAGDYCPENCRWATRNQQMRNRRDNVRLTVDGVTKTIVEWAEITGIHPQTITSRIQRLGWEPERAIKAEPEIRTPDPVVEFNGTKLTLHEWSDKTGINWHTLRWRLKRGWSLEKTLTTAPGPNGVKYK